MPVLFVIHSLNLLWSEIILECTLAALKEDKKKENSRNRDQRL